MATDMNPSQLFRSPSGSLCTDASSRLIRTTGDALLLFESSTKLKFQESLQLIVSKPATWRVPAYVVQALNIHSTPDNTLGVCHACH